MIYLILLFKHLNLFNYNVKRMQRNSSNRYQAKHKLDKKFTCCPTKNALPRDLVEKP